MPKLFHPQFEQLYDRKTGLQFSPERIGEGAWRATAEVPDELVADFLERGYQYVDPPAPEPVPEPSGTPKKAR